MRFALGALLFVVACGAGPAPKTVSLRVTGTPPDARVTIDDRLIGSLGLVIAHGVALPPGRHRITVEKPGYFPFDRMVEATEGKGPIRLEIALIPIPE
jgi:hypothetical protein